MRTVKENLYEIKQIDDQINELLSQQKTIRKKLWFPSLNSDLNSMDSIIANLQRDKADLFDIILKSTAPTPSKYLDLSTMPPYSKPLESTKGHLFGYLVMAGSVFHLLRASRRYWYVLKAHRAIKMKNLYDIDVFMHRAGLSSVKQVRFAKEDPFPLLFAAIISSPIVCFCVSYLYQN